MKALIFSVLTVTAVFIVMLLTMVATGSPAAIVAIVAKSRPMLGVFSLCVMVVWFVFRAIGREIRRQR